MSPSQIRHASILIAATLSLALACAGSEDFQANEESSTGGSHEVGGGAGTGASGGLGGGAGGGAGAAPAGGASGSSGSAGAGGASASGGGGSNGSGGGNPNGNPNGTGCIVNGECGSGICADGVCCNTTCDGECVSCSLPGQAGACAPHAADTNPESGCLGGAKTSGMCTGTCDGKGSCKLPGAEKSCGATACSSGNQTGSACDGQGVCASQQTTCAPYVCGASTCKTTCSVDPDCVAGHFCKAGACVAKQELGVACSAGNQCKSNSCVDGSCCASASCGASFSCSTGACKCNGQSCAAGDACVPWYEDADGDGFGDQAKAVNGCSSKPPLAAGKTYVQDATDCFDANKNAHPGQTAFFATPRADGSFDYDCVGGEERMFKNVGGLQCVDCRAASVEWCSFPEIKCGVSMAAGGTMQSMGFECNLPNYCGGPKTTQGFAFDVPCGGSADLKGCSKCFQSTPASQGSTHQLCR